MWPRSREQIANRCDQVRVVLIAGPSSSGKTTFSKRLAVQLLACGIVAFPLEMDNYFVDREKTPTTKMANSISNRSKPWTANGFPMTCAA